MAYIATPEDRARKLRLAESAAAAAIGNGCTPDEVRRAVEAGIADEMRVEAQRRAARAGTATPTSPAPGPRADTAALDAWAATVA